ncbi:MAG: VWA domain-containing protein [Proteobacteria bacterium]|nr:VWA domain-containing protein [Pseudomonadota bacterium]
MILGTPAELWTAEALELREPMWAWLLILVPLLVFVLPKAAGVPDRIRSFCSLVVRMGALTALVLAAVQPVTPVEVPDLSLVVALDGSASMTAERRADVEAVSSRYLEGVEVPTVHLELPVSADEGTDLAALIGLAVARAPEARSRRVLLLSDGADTQRDAEHDRAVAAAALAGAQSVQIHAIPPGVPGANRGIVGLEIPLPVEQGTTVTARVQLLATGASEGVLQIRRGDEVLVEQGVALQPGRQSVELTFRAPEAGTHAIEVRFARADGWPQDDRRGGWLVSTTDGAVLVQGPGSDVVAGLLRRRGLPARSVDDIPRAPAEGTALFVLAPDMEAWDPELPELLRELVQERGVDLVLAGGPQGLGSDEPFMDPLDRALPVVFPQKKKRQPPPLAVAYVLDRSDSMARESKLDLAVAAVTQSVGILSDDARVGVLAFSDDADWVVPMTRASNRDAILEAVGTLRVQGGTNMYPALEEAFDALAATDALVKHIILLTDGRSATRFDQHLHLMERISASRVTVSTVALSQEAAVEELGKVAETGRGRAWVTDSFDDLPKIFVDETMTLLRKNAVAADETVRAMPGSPLAGTVDWTEAPVLSGHNEARPKPTASLGLVMGDRSRPLLASWRYGLGSATVFTSELGAGWGGRWLEWKGLGGWLEALVEAIRLRPPDETLWLTLDAGQDATIGLTVLDALGVPREGLTPLARVRGAAGEVDVPLSEQVPGYYVGHAAWDDALLVSVSVPAGPGTPAGTIRGQVGPPPPLELSGALLDLTQLEAIARASGGRVLPDPEQLLIEGVRTRRDSHEHWPWLTWLGLGLFLLDIGIRRVRSPSA